MDEADKYKQRLEAIAEKRRLQEEQERARREMEDERLRLQQLKRKSLRDQWLMDGAPLSPSNPDAQSPRSPLWGSQTQEIEKHVDGLQSQNLHVAAKKEKLREQMEYGQMEAVKVGEAASEIVHAALQSRENHTEGSEKTEDDDGPRVDETTAVVTNGRGDLEADVDPKASEHSNRSTTNGPVVASEDVISTKAEPGLCSSEAEPGRAPHVNINEEEEEGTLVIRAERVIVTDEEDDAPEEPIPHEDQGESMQSEGTPPLSPEAGFEEKEEVVDEVVQPESSLESFPTELPAEAQPEPADDMQSGANLNGETEEQDVQSEHHASEAVQSSANPVEGSTLSPVPVYSETPVNPELEAEGAAAAPTEEAEPEGKVQEPVTLPDQFQEVPLADPLENHRTEVGPEGEQEPLLSQVKALVTQVELGAAGTPTATETYGPSRASRGEETEAPKRKTCQCCSIM